MKLTAGEPIPERLKNTYLSLLDPIVIAATRMNVHPNTFTSIGFGMGAIATYFVVTGSLRLAGLFILLSGLMDSIDGKLARHTGKVSRFGALYDSTMDRYGEVLFFFGAAYYFIKTGRILTSVAVAVGLGGSLMVSYVRARAEGLGFDCKVGWMQRAERMILLGTGCLIHPHVFALVMWIIAILSNFTTFQRLWHIRNQDRNSQTNTTKKEEIE